MIRSGDFIIVRGGDTHRMIACQHKTNNKIGRLGFVHIGSLVGQPFDATYAVDEQSKRFELVSDDMLPDHECDAQNDEIRAAATSGGAGAVVAGDGEGDGEGEGDAEGGTATAAATAPTAAVRDNRNLVDRNTAQSLTTEQLQELKARDGVKGIVSLLVQNSATFASKTAFSQDKYIKRKKIKYNTVFRVERPTPASLCELWCPSMVRAYADAVDARGCPACAEPGAGRRGLRADPAAPGVGVPGRGAVRGRRTGALGAAAC